MLFVLFDRKYISAQRVKAYFTSPNLIKSLKFWHVVMCHRKFLNKIRGLPKLSVKLNGVLCLTLTLDY